jgi:transcriptional regulator with XRE-family HTH domain
MEPRIIARALCAIRRRKGWSQRKLAEMLGVSQQAISLFELSGLETCSVAFAQRWARALGADLFLDLRLAGQRVQADSRHAGLQDWLAALLAAWGWLVAVEVSFNHFGDRGRIDILAFHPLLRIVLVVEVKTRLDDAQDLLGRLDVKVRLARKVSAERGWEATQVVPVLLFAEDRTTRRRVDRHPALFARFSHRTVAARRWLQQPQRPTPDGLLLFANPRRGN